MDRTTLGRMIADRIEVEAEARRLRMVAEALAVVIEYYSDCGAPAEPEPPARPPERNGHTNGHGGDHLVVTVIPPHRPADGPLREMEVERPAAVVEQAETPQAPPPPAEVPAAPSQPLGLRAAIRQVLRDAAEPLYPDAIWEQAERLGATTKDARGGVQATLTALIQMRGETAETEDNRWRLAVPAAPAPAAAPADLPADHRHTYQWTERSTSDGRMYRCDCGAETWRPYLPGNRKVEATQG